MNTSSTETTAQAIDNVVEEIGQWLERIQDSGAQG